MASVLSFPRRERQALGLIGTAHLLSHIYMLALAPLLPLITGDLDISYAEFGVALAAYAIATGVFQTPMGLLVERIGGRIVLIAGLFLNSLSFLLVGLVASDVWQLTALLAVAGIGSAVFHPADYSLMSAAIGDKRLGRAFSIHTFVGHLGFIIGPIMTASLEPVIGWRGAVITLGALGLAATGILIMLSPWIAEGTKVAKQRPMTDSLRELMLSPAVLLFFVFYVCTSAANVGITQFAVVAFQDMYELDRVTAVTALTAYQVGTLLLVLPGGILADRTTRYDLIMILGFGATAVLTCLVGTGWFPFWLTVVMLCLAGALRGGVNTSRDVAVRRLPVNVPIGTLFGFISTGFLVGQALGGPFYGWLFDNFEPPVIFYVSAAVYLLGLGTVLFNPGARQQAAYSD